MTVIDVRGVPRALFGSSAARVAELTAWDATIRRPIGAVRRIGFVQLGSGVGGTSLAREVLRVVSVRRALPPLAVDASESGALARSLGIEPTMTREHRAFRTSAEALAGLERGPHGEWAMRPASAPTDAVEAWIDEVSPVTRFFEVAVTDFGPRHPHVDLAPAAALCEAVCIVSIADRGQAEIAHSMAQAIAELPERPEVVLALTDLGAPPRRVPETVGAFSASPVVHVPRDLGLARGSAALTVAAREALLELTALLIGGARR
ncbi:hypothetical protein LG315_06740 [Microbacterium marinum]|uniref:hypothetical protein n=1 Tax=Microbacterium marinum TaxID=421115 RepID=UPI0038513F92